MPAARVFSACVCVCVRARAYPPCLGQPCGVRTVRARAQRDPGRFPAGSVQLASPAQSDRSRRCGRRDGAAPPPLRYSTKASVPPTWPRPAPPSPSRLSGRTHTSTHAGVTQGQCIRRAFWVRQGLGAESLVAQRAARRNPETAEALAPSLPPLVQSRPTAHRRDATRAQNMGRAGHESLDTNLFDRVARRTSPQNTEMPRKRAVIHRIRQSHFFSRRPGPRSCWAQCQGSACPRRPPGRPASASGRPQ